MTRSRDVLILAHGIAEAMIAHARDAAPRECCGLLVGAGERAAECVPTRNLSTDSGRYLVDPAEHIRLNRRLRGSGRSVIGAYHSHPRTPAEPSPRDIREAHYPEFFYVIVSLTAIGTDIVRAFHIDEGKVTAVRLDREVLGVQA